MKDVTKKAVFVIVLLAIGYWVISGKVAVKRTKTEKRELETKESIEAKKLVSALADKHNAVVDWRQALDKEEKFWRDSTYTIEAEEVLIRADGRPILFFGGIEDIIKENDKYLVYWGDNDWSYFSDDDIKGNKLRRNRRKESHGNADIRRRSE